MRRAALAVVVLIAAVTPALADDAVCAKLSWPLDHELSLMRGTLPAFQAGYDSAGVLPLAAAASASLPYPSEKPAAPNTYAGSVLLPAPAAGDYLVSLSADAWIDVVQDGRTVASVAHAGDPNCPGLRKSVRFTLHAAPATLEISNAPGDRIGIAVTPWYRGRATK